MTGSGIDNRVCCGSSAMDFAEQLRTADLRVTRPRIAVLQAVCATPHSDTEAIFEAVRAVLPSVCRQTVYDVLHAMTDVGMLRRVQPPGSSARYECRVDDHHHMICRSCGAMADIDCAAVGDAPCLTVSATNGFHLDQAEVMFWGLCPTCSVSDASQGLLDDSSIEQPPDEMLCVSNTRPVPPSNDQPMPTPTPWPGPGQWLALAHTEFLLKATGNGTGGQGTSAWLARDDVAAATVPGNRSRDESSLPDWVDANIRWAARPG
jgi:Fe2+ or Zn2+ uptake regulation protein